MLRDFREVKEIIFGVEFLNQSFFEIYFYETMISYVYYVQLKIYP